ncbi:aminopeptidase P family protein [Allofrancisella guangzhouensis]|uniref:Xaa-Pro aminopeptidase n=1 Tax=Allofrancisella guangzhouensis TaxID=594679 RepID=A0A0A8EAH0_9GAMM|nr:aminopeptidase P family protein [Allofrancisella guangzhouensis]AJC49156.1 Xaa-Pro aminopeptidase [Allofrancisella guangzhouensis]MBK2026786.1 aminopeptidase P family protein [Allofrancisella guangzhouensis]MBK2044021.1 aminopeptidase P family protein [Allofrancisella guangzhouensis]MBK2045331.1 aminopeptidase P family protein [Allofrancisella guangzhouensis]
MSQKLQVLRKLMNEKGYDFYLVPSIDDHNNEYVPECWQYRAWISDFDGSAGDVLVALDYAYLSTDGRYFSQAEYQLEKGFFTLLKQTGLESEIEKWLVKNFTGKTLAIDPKKIGITRALGLLEVAAKAGGEIVFDSENLVAKAQQKLHQSVSVPANKIFEQQIQYAGQSIGSKLNSIRKELKEKSQNALVVSSLDEIMWTLNIRGRDIEHTPIAISYLVITLVEVYFYIDSSKLDNQIKDYLSNNKVTVKEYTQFFDDLTTYEARYLLDATSASFAIKQAIEQNDKSSILVDRSPIVLSKAIKNSVEINGAKDAHRKDAAAFIRWWYWLENNYQGINELQAVAKLAEYRAQQKGYVEDSFPYIVGHGANGAIIHYKPKNNSQLKTLDDQTPLLCDSGGQYKEGTTDITRVLHFGRPTIEHKRYYTLVLKGHLALGRAIFPKGTTGSQLDVLAREHLWHFCADYSHGTGHGVGSFLGVHEGPQRINSSSKVELMPGMILSNEPGAYFPGEFGIRIENLCYVKQRNQESPTGHGPFYYFEDLTLIPYEYKLIETYMLTYTEKKTINNYYSRIRKEVLPLIEEEEVKDFLLFKTRHIK